MKIFQGLRRFFSKIGRFLRDVRSELKKVIWPSWGELRVYTAAVLVAMVGVGVILWGTDGLLTLVMSFITKK
ncbi:MAG TPA: preprotein translocase subunit SecE [Firmicutes bacterium]|nr:preprotein translocase subunit SecE [Candidatus Fermentithermobacillaceae bacterium]